MTSTWKDDAGGRVMGRDVCACCSWLKQLVSKLSVSIFLRPGVKRLRGISNSTRDTPAVKLAHTLQGILVEYPSYL